MLHGIGIDIATIARFKNQKNKKSFLKNYLNNEEILLTTAANNKDSCCAVMFALKEAVMKAFGLGIGSGVNFRDIAVNKNFKIKLRGANKTINKNKKKILSSKTDSEKYALGLAILCD